MDEKEIAKAVISKTLDKPTATDKQIAEIQSYTAFEIDSAIKDLDRIIDNCELNNNKPEVVYRHARDARFKLSNLSFDLKKDTKISE